MPKPIRVLVTGGAGYIGTILVRVLLDAGYHVTVVDSFRYGQATVLAAYCADPNFELVRGDVRDRALMKHLTGRADIVIPLAALVGAPLCARCPDEATAVNYHAIDWLAASLSKDQHLIYPNSNSGYGIGSDEACTEESPLNPVSHYGQTKCLGEQAALNHERTTVFRLATVFGASPRHRVDLLVNDFTLRAIRDRALVLFEGGFRRNFVHIRDVAEAFAWAFETQTFGVFNLGHDDANVTKRELCERIKLQVPEFTYFESNTHSDPDRRDYLVSNAKLRAAGFEAGITLDEGIEELIKLYQGFPTTQWGNV